MIGTYSIPRNGFQLGGQAKEETRFRDENRVSEGTDTPSESMKGTGMDTSTHLTSTHRELLLSAAITPDVIDASGITSRNDGILFPWRDGDGETVWQFRPDEPPLNDEGEPIKYRFRKGASIPLNHLRVTGSKDLLIVEGTKQSYAALSHAPAHVDIVGMSGCYGWKNADLSVAYGKRVYVLLDSDLETNLNVWKAAGQLKQALEDEGADETLYVRTSGKAKDGLDDVLARYEGSRRADMMKVWLTNATPKRGPKPRAKADPKRTEAASRLASGASFDAEAIKAMGADYALSDRLMAERVSSSTMADRMMFSPELGWMEWNGKVWARIDDCVAVERVGDFLKKWVAAETVQATVPVSPKERATLLSRSRINAITDLCKGLTTAEGDSFDTHPDLLTCDNGVINLRTGELGAFDPTLRLTTFVPTAYKPDATHVDVVTALSSMEPGVRDWTQVRLGQGITGLTPDDDTLPLLHGQGSNGKSVLISAAIATLGVGTNGAIRQLSDAVLLGDRDAKEEKMALRGARIVFLEELPEGARLNVNHLKKIVGTETVTSRHLYRKEVTWSASHSLFITTNYLPQVAETDHGTWRRLARIPFPYKFVTGTPEGPHERKGDPRLRSRMKGREQREAFLAWLVAGARRWYECGRVMPQAPSEVAAATEEWRGESDSVVKFWAESLVVDPDCHIPANELSDALNSFLEAEGKSKWSANVVASRFGGHDVVSRSGVEKRKVRRSSATSTRPGSTVQVSSGTFAAWVGVRFRREDEVVPDPVEPSGVEMSDDVEPVEADVPRLPAGEAVSQPVGASSALVSGDAVNGAEVAVQGFDDWGSEAEDDDPFLSGL
jgi:putative DNA primase/helicase